MQEVEVSRFVQAAPAEVERALMPARIIEYEESFTVRDVAERDDETVVTAGGRGLEFAFRFEPRPDGLFYAQEDDGPLDTLKTTLTYTPRNEGTRVTARSHVRMGMPPAIITDRVAAWKRRGELERALANLAADLE